MNTILNNRERQALQSISRDRENFTRKGELPVGLGKKTFEKLLVLGLIETGPIDKFSAEVGYKITRYGWLCMYGKSYEDIMALPGSDHALPLEIWSWPPSNS